MDTTTPLRFLGVGALNTLAGLTIIFAAKALFRLGDVPANGLGYGCGLALSFVLNRRWTFAHSGPRWPALVKFLAGVGVAYGANLTVVMAAIGLGLNAYVAQALGVPVYTVIVYCVSRRFAFVHA